MIDWGDTLRETEERAAALAIRNYTRESGLRAEIGRVGSPQNATGENFSETPFNLAGEMILRCDRIAIDDGWLID